MNNLTIRLIRMLKQADGANYLHPFRSVSHKVSNSTMHTRITAFNRVAALTNSEKQHTHTLKHKHV